MRSRPVVNLDLIGALLDRALDHPLAQVAEDLAPATIDQLRALRAHLPEAASELEAMAVDAARAEVERELAVIEQAMAAPIARFLARARKRQGKAEPKRLPAPKARKRKGKGAA